MKFKNYIETESGIKDTSTSPGAAGQVLSSTVSGTSWIDQSTLVSGSAERVSILVKNGEGTALVKGDPVYIIGSVGASARLEVGLCDASDPSKMPCVGLLEQDLLNNGQGTAVTAGKLRNLATTPIDGQPTTENDTIYVKAGGSSGLALTTTKPTGSTNLIQNVGQVGRVSASSSGNFVVSAIMRTNDVPNLPTGKIWVGDGNTTVSTIVHLDETNGRMGVGTASPGATFHVSGGAIRIDDAQQLQFGNGNVNIRNDASGRMYLRAPLAYYFEGNGGYKMVLDGNSGNLGIGTTSPQEKLHVQNYTTGESHQAMFKGGAVAVGDYSYISLNNGYGTEYNKEVRLAAVSEQSNSNKTGFAILTSPDSNGASGHERLRVTADGNVGISTTNPRSKLHVQGVTGSVPALGAAASAAQIGGTTYGTLFSTLTSGTGVIQQGRSDGNTLTFPLLINPNGGNVGIGTTSPNHELVVQGASSPNIELKNSNYSNGGFILNRNNYGHQWKWWAESNVMYFGFSTDESTYSTKLAIESSGDVGIGTTSPSHRLHVVGANNDPIIRAVRGNNTAQYLDIRGYQILSQGNHLLLTADDTKEIWLGQESNTQRMVINASGNVGIGTTSPSEKLEVNGHIKAVDGYKGYVSHFHSGGFDHFPRSGDAANPMWIPSNYIVDASTDQYYNVWVPLYAGRIRKIILKNITGTPTATVCTFRKKINGVLSGTTYAGTVTGGGAAGMKVTFDFGTTNFTFNAEDEVQIGIVTGVAPQPPMRGVSYQIWYEYNIT